MEPGRGVVAIVQGSRHAGLTVTVLPDTHRSCRRRHVPDMGMKSTRGCKSNVETNTEWISKNSEIPVWDVRYDSGYQFANCLRSPSSQQRNTFLGNGSGEMEQFSAGSHLRDSFMHRGRSSCSRPAHHMVSFMQSLRQYPRAVSSAELLQRALDRACHRHHTKKHSRSVRSSLRKSTSQHTHRSKKPDHVTSQKNTSSRKPLERSASVIGKRCSSQEELLNYTYDYLKSSSFNRRRTDVRYLTEMKRALKDRLREIIDSKPTVCPNIQSRYIMHKKYYCGVNKHTSEAGTNNAETQVRQPTEAKALPKAYESSYNTSKHACFCQPSERCICQKRHDAKYLSEIKEWMNTIPVYPNFSADDKTKLDQMFEKLTNTLKQLLKEPDFNFKAKKEIIRFLNAIPMWHPKDSQEDALFKEQLADNLIEKLEEAAEIIFDEEIANCIEELPLDFANINKDEINRIKEKFGKRLKQIAVNPPANEEEYKEALKSELLNLLEDLPLKYDNQKTKSEIAEKFANKLYHMKLPASKEITENLQEPEIHKKVSDICKGIPELSNLKASDKKKLAQFLQDKMEEYNPKDLEDSQVQQKVQREIKEWLDNTAFSEHIDVKTKNKLAKKITQLLRTDRKTIGGEHKKPNVLQKVRNLTKAVPELADLNASEQKELADFLNNMMSKYDSEDLEDNDIQQKMQEEIKEWLDNTAFSEHFDVKTKNKLAKKITQLLRTDRKTIGGEHKKSNVLQKVRNLTKAVPELADLTASEQKELADFLNNMMRKYDSEDLEDNDIQQKMQEEIKEWLDNTTISGNIDSKTKEKLAKIIIQELQTDNIKGDYQDTLGLIERWFQGIPELSGGDSVTNKKALQDLATQLDEILTSGEDVENIQVDLRETIADWLQNMIRKNNRRLSLTTQENLINKLLKKLNDAPKPKGHMQKEGHNMYDDVVAWIKDIPGINSNIELDQSNAIEDLMNTLNDIRNNSDEELVEQQTKDAINRFIANLSDNAGVEIDPRHRKLLQQKLLGQMKRAAPQRKRWDRPNGFGSSTPNTYASGAYSLSPELSAIHNVSIIDGETKIEEYINTIKNLIDTWIKNLELKIGSNEQKNLVQDIASDVVDRQKYLQLSNNKTSEADELEHLKYQIFRRLNKFNLEDLPRIISRVNDLHKTLLPARAPELIKTSNRSDLTRNINNLVNSIKVWLDNIPTDLDISYNKPTSDDVFLDLAQKLAELKDSTDHYHIKKEILQWLPKLFKNLNTNTLNNLADSLKSHLMNDLAQSVTRDVTPGSMYRQTLWDTISKTLPPIHMTSADDLHAFDLLKERLVDAFINLHYFADDMTAVDKFRTKLFNEVNKFCNEYLKRYPEPPMDSEEIGKNLYNALRKVSVPNIETVRSELEQVRLKEEILDWLSDVPLEKSKSTEPQINAMASGLAKRLHGLEKEKHRDLNNDEIKREIMKWLQELPLRNKEQVNLEEYVDKLMDKLQSTDKSRTLSVSKVGKYDDNITSSRQTPQYPRSNLSAEDRAHLERIKRRIDCSRGNRTRCICKDASVSPPPRESGIQTHPSMYERCNMVNREISPQVIIKEYYWDSTGSNVSMRERMVDSHRTCSPCSPCNKTTETPAQIIRISQRTKDSQTETINPFQRSQIDKICDKRSCSLGTLADRRSCLQTTAPPCYFPEERRTNQRINLPSENIGPRRSKVDTCCNCGQRIYTKCRGRHHGYRPHCNLTCLKYCVNCGSGCPYPSSLYFRKEF